MGLILDSSVLITAERKGETVGQLLQQIFAAVGDQDTVLSAIALMELAHGIHRANTPQIRSRREAFIQELLRDVPVYPFTEQIAFLAGTRWRTAEQRSQDSIPGPADRRHCGASPLRGSDRESATLRNDPRARSEATLRERPGAHVRNERTRD